MSTVSRKPRPVKPKPPLSARWLGGADDEGRRLLLIRKDGRDHTYLCSPILGSDDGDCGPELLGFRVEQPGKADVYDVDFAAGTCDCPAGTYHGRCLHRQGLLLAVRGAPESVGYAHGADNSCPF